MDILQTQIHPNEADFNADAEHNRALAAELREHMAKIRQGGRYRDPSDRNPQQAARVSRQEVECRS